MDAEAKTDLREILEGVVKHPELLDEAVISIADIVDCYRRRLHRRHIEWRICYQEVLNEKEKSQD